MEIWDVGDGTFAEEFTGIERAGPRERLCALKELKPYVWGHLGPWKPRQFCPEPHMLT